jgi:hypothetical protein
LGRAIVVPSAPIVVTSAAPVSITSTPVPPWVRKRLIARDAVDVLVLFEKVGDVEKCVALQADIHERRLHPG